LRAIDTNVLVYAEVRSSPHHAIAMRILTGLARDAAPWAIPWPCIYEFLRVVTHQRIYHPPMPLKAALGDLGRIFEVPNLVLLSETPAHEGRMVAVLEGSGATGNLIHDAHIAALCLEHGVSELITGDRDFLRFKDLNVTNPFE